MAPGVNISRMVILVLCKAKEEMPGAARKEGLQAHCVIDLVRPTLSDMLFDFLDGRVIGIFVYRGEPV